MQTGTTAPKKGIDFIVNSKRVYPDWIKQHRVFAELSSIDKVFPRIGLSNFKEPCEILNTQEAAKYAMALANRILTEINNTVLVKLQADMDKLNFGVRVPDREKQCSALVDIIGLYSAVARSLTNAPSKDGNPEYVIVKDGKTSINLRYDIFSAKETTKPVFKKGEVLLRVLNKLKDMYPAYFVNADQLQEFKDYSRTNVGKSVYNVVFSSTGDEGQWDIATASMRGIASCQSWNAPQSRGLIGTMSSKYTAVIYMESGTEMVAPYGTKMLYRSMVRFCINNKTKKPEIVIDKMYPSVNEATLAAFKRVLSKKSGMNIVYAPNNTGTNADYYIPSETAIASFLAQGETSYMDTKINVSEHKVKQIAQVQVQNLTALTDKFRASVAADINKLLVSKREEHTAAFSELEKKRAEFFAAKTAWENSNGRQPFTLASPKMDDTLARFFRNGVENLFSHCDKKHGNNSAGKCFADMIMNLVSKENLAKCTTPEAYHKQWLMNFLREHGKIRELAKVDTKKGSWHKSFPKSSERIHDFVFSLMKGYIMGGMKELLKGGMN